MDPGGTLLGYFAVVIGSMAATIAVGGFLGHVHPAFTRESEEKLRRMTAAGGLWGLGVSVGIIVLSVFIG